MVPPIFGNSLKILIEPFKGTLIAPLLKGTPYFRKLPNLAHLLGVSVQQERADLLLGDEGIKGLGFRGFRV